MNESATREGASPAVDRPTRLPGSGGPPTNPRSLLLLAYYFPPLVDTATLRYVTLCRYAASLGWAPTVLSVSNPDESYCMNGNGPQEPFPATTVHRARSVANVYWLTNRIDAILHRMAKALRRTWKRNIVTQLMVPDIFAGWIPMATLKGWRLIRRDQPALIVAGCKPMSSAVIGAVLKKMTGTPLVLDFQDPWRFELIIGYARHQKANVEAPIKAAQWISAILETWVLRVADHIIVTAEDTKGLYEQAYPFAKGKVSVVHIGFGDAFGPAQVPSAPVARPERFTLLYTGNYYYHADPSDAIFRAIRHLLDRGVLSPELFEFVFVGSYGPWLGRLIKQHGLESVVRIVGYVRQDQVREYLDSASMFFIRLFRPCVNLSTKVFEAMAVGIPILAHIDEGEQAAMIRASSCSHYIVGADDERGLEEALAEAFRRWRAGTLTREINLDYTRGFNPSAISAKMAAIFDGSAAGQPS